MCSYSYMWSTVTSFITCIGLQVPGTVKDKETNTMELIREKFEQLRVFSGYPGQERQMC